LIPLIWALRGTRSGRGAWLGFAFGFTYYGILLYWLIRFGLIAWAPLVLSQAAYAALFGALAPRLWREGRPMASAVALAALWTGVDWARAVWPLGGFTWGALGNTQHGNGFILPLASLTGVWGITFVVVLANGLVLGAVQRVGEWRRAATLVATAAGAVLLPGAIPLPAPNGPPVEVAVVQGNVPKERATDFYIRTREVAQNHVTLHGELAGDPPDFAVWPENSLDVDPASDPSLEAAVSESIRSVSVPTLAGAVTDAPGDRFYNQVLHYSERGEIQDRYTKMHPVPFGEYVPFRSFLGWVDQLRFVPRDIAPGAAFTTFDLDGVVVGTPICFENTFPDLFRRFVSSGATVMVVATNDSSYADSPASRQHVIFSKIRAVETGRWVVQAAISGESAVIDPRGRVVARTDLFTRTILRHAVVPSTARTLYVRWGDWFAWAAGISTGLVLGARTIRGRRGSRPSRRRWRLAGPPPGEGGADQDRQAAPAPIAGAAVPRVLVVLPTYDERETIDRVLAGVIGTGPNVDALVIDDGSPDGTAEVVEAMAAEEPRIRLLHRRGKQGLASAYLLGFRRALEDRYDVIVEMDADLSHRPEDLPKLIEGADRYDLTIGSRYVPGGGVTNWSRARLALSKGGNAYARALLGLPVSDATSGFRAFRRPVLEALLGAGINSDGYAFQVELAYRAWRDGFTIGEVPITFREREHGRSKISRRIVVEAVVKIGRWGLRDRFGPGPRRRPARLSDRP
jgi:apolipoprotein N-acyltransferase